MTIPSAPAPPALPNVATENRPPTAATPPAGQFEHYLQTETTSDAENPSGNAKGKIDRIKATAVVLSSPGVQTNLAALLYALPARNSNPLPTPGTTTDAGAGDELIPADREASEGAPWTGILQPAGVTLPGRWTLVETKPALDKSALARGGNSNTPTAEVDEATAQIPIDSISPQTPSAVEFAAAQNLIANSLASAPSTPAILPGASEPRRSSFQNQASSGDTYNYIVSDVTAPVEKVSGTSGATASPGESRAKAVRAKAATDADPTPGAQTSSFALLQSLPASHFTPLPTLAGTNYASSTIAGGEASAPIRAKSDDSWGTGLRARQAPKLTMAGESYPVATTLVSGGIANVCDRNSNNPPPGNDDATVASITGPVKPQPPSPAELSGASKTDGNSAQTNPAIPAAAASVATPPAETSQTFTLPEEADISLLSATAAPLGGSRGTGGAKAVREMNETSAATNLNAPSSGTVDGPTGATLSAAVAGLEDKLPGRGKPLIQESTAAANGDANRGRTETLSMAVTGLPTSLGHAPGATGTELPATQPMAPPAILGEVGLGLERIQQSGASRLDLHLSLEGGGQVSIALQMRDGAVHASIVTASAELRTALQQGWSQLSSRSESLGLSLATPVFKSPTATMSTAGQQEFRERREASPQEQNPLLPSSIPANQPKRPVPSAATTLLSSTGLNAWA